MRKVLTIILLAFSFLATAQTQPPISQGSKLYQFRNGVKIDSALFLPRKDTGVTDGTMRAPGMLLYRSIDSLLYYMKGNTMTSLTIGADGKFVHYTDTTAMLASRWDSTFVKANFPIDTVSTITIMSAYSGKAKILYVQDTLQGGLFYQTATGAANGGTIFTGIGGKYWNRSVANSNFRASWWGIKPGVADQYTAINTMLSSIPDYSVVNFDVGKSYNISNKILITKPVYINGNGSTLNFTGANIEIVSIRSSNVTIDQLNVKGNTNATYQGLGKCIITENGSPTSYYTNINILNCKVSNHRYGGIYLRYVDRFNIEGNKCDSFPYAGIIVFSCRNGTIHKNVVNNIHGTGSAGLNAYGISATKNNATATDSVCENISITDNIITNVPTWEGIDCHGGKQISILGNVLTGTGRGISVVDEDDTSPSGPQNININGNIVNSEGVNNDGNLYAIYLTGSDAVLDYATGSISGNTLIGGGVYLRTTRGVVISNNAFIRPWNAGIYMNHDNIGASIVNNAITDVYQLVGSNAAGITATATGNNNAFISGNSLIRGNMPIPPGGTVNAFGYRSNGIVASNTATFGVNGFESAITSQYFNLNDPININVSTTPESVIIAPPGSIAVNKSGGSGATLFVKETGTGNTGWKSYSPITGGTGYIQNQTAAAQSADFNISGGGTFFKAESNSYSPVIEIQNTGNSRKVGFQLNNNTSSPSLAFWINGRGGGPGGNTMMDVMRLHPYGLVVNDSLPVGAITAYDPGATGIVAGLASVGKTNPGRVRALRGSIGTTPNTTNLELGSYQFGTLTSTTVGTVPNIYADIVTQTSNTWASDNPVDMIFKTTSKAGGPIAERMRIDSNGNVNATADVIARHYISKGTIPTFTPNGATNSILGTGYSFTISGNDTYMYITITTGTGITTSGTIGTIDFNTAYSAAPVSVWSCANINALTTNVVGFNAGTGSGITVFSSANLLPSTTYNYNIITGQ